MADLDIISKGGGNYLFTANGCYLEYFVIWEEGETPRWEKVVGSNNYYQMSYNLKENTTYNFHVYAGNKSDDFRGKMVYET